MSERDQSCARSQQRLVLFQHDLAAIIDRDDPDDSAAFLRDYLPGNNVGMMFKCRQHDLVAGLQKLSAVRLRDQVDPFCRTTVVDDFLLRPGADESLDLLSSLLEGVG